MAESKETTRNRPGAGRPGFRGPGGGHGMGAPAAKSKDFKGSGRRLLGLAAPHRAMIATVIVLAVISVTFNILGPRLLGNATNLLFIGVLSARMPAGVTQQEYIAKLQAQGQTQLAQMMSGLHLTPGMGVDFAAIGRILLLLIAVYVPVSYTHLRAHETRHDLVCRLLLE